MWLVGWLVGWGGRQKTVWAGGKLLHTQGVWAQGLWAQGGQRELQTHAVMAVLLLKNIHVCGVSWPTINQCVGPLETVLRHGKRAADAGTRRTRKWFCGKESSAYNTETREVLSGSSRFSAVAPPSQLDDDTYRSPVRKCT